MVPTIIVEVRGASSMVELPAEDGARFAGPAATLLHRVEAWRVQGTADLDAGRRSKLGQFLTPISVAEFMVAMLGDLGDRTIRVLEPGAGVGSLLAAFCVEIVKRSRRPKAIMIVAYEIEARLVPHLRRTLAAAADVCRAAGVTFEAVVREEDFVGAGVTTLAGGLFSRPRELYDVALLNPPYGKIRSDSRERLLLRQAGIEASNLYAAFVALAAQLLAPNGELVAITPRSFCNGPYFRPFRELLIETLALQRLHVFEARDQAFADDKVLQENVIVHATRSTQTDIVVSSSVGVDDDLIATRTVASEHVIGPRPDGSVFRIVPDDLGEVIAQGNAEWRLGLTDLGLTVSTGRVVDFRARAHLRAEPGPDTVPLIYPGHFDGATIRWPRIGYKKPNAIVAADETRSLFFPAGWYVVVKRLSAKEERRRIVAAVYEPTTGDDGPVAFENHVNVFHLGGRGLPRELARGLCAFLNSAIVDAAFRQFNGNTQVNATDLRALRYPNADVLAMLGRRTGPTSTADELDDQVAQELLGMAGAKAMRGLKRIGQASQVLRELGLPKAQQNERSALTLLALLDLKPSTPWVKARNPSYGITPMMEFFRDHYGKNYAPNSRETVRRSTIHQFVAAGLVVQNPDNPGRPVTSGDTVYQVTTAVLAAMKTFQTSAWPSARDHLVAARPGLVAAQDERRVAARLPVKLPSGKAVTLTPGGQNDLIKQVVEEFCPRFVPAPRCSTSATPATSG